MRVRIVLDQWMYIYIGWIEYICIYVCYVWKGRLTATVPPPPCTTNNNNNTDKVNEDLAINSAPHNGSASDHLQHHRGTPIRLFIARI